MAQLPNTTRPDPGGFATTLALLVAVLIGIAVGLARDWPSEGERADWLSSSHQVMVTSSVIGSGHQCRCDDDIHHVFMASRRDDGAIVPPQLPAATPVAVLGGVVHGTPPPLAARKSLGSVPDGRIAIMRTTRLVI